MSLESAAKRFGLDRHLKILRNWRWRRRVDEQRFDAEPVEAPRPPARPPLPSPRKEHLKDLLKEPAAMYGMDGRDARLEEMLKIIGAEAATVVRAQMREERGIHGGVDPIVYQWNRTLEHAAKKIEEAMCGRPREE